MSAINAFVLVRGQGEAEPGSRGYITFDLSPELAITPALAGDEARR